MNQKKRGRESPEERYRLRRIRPMTDNQVRLFQEYEAGKSLLVHGIAGTGKTFVTSYLALREVLEHGLEDLVGRFVIVRSVVPTRDVGFLPGSLKEKYAVYEQPYRDIFAELFGKSEAYEYMKGRGVVEFTTTSFERGISFRDCIVLVDEVQNMSPGELNTVITRVGENCRIMFCGDLRQTDLVGREKTGLGDFMRILTAMQSFSCIEMGVHDIVRSGMVREYYEVRDRLERESLVTPLCSG